MKGHGFFDRSETHELLAELGAPADWTIYVGLGATIDRTRISWRTLIVRLFMRLGYEESLAELVVRQHGEVGAATILEDLYYASRPRHVQKLQADIGSLLYGSFHFMGGQILNGLADFALENARLGKSVSFVTPNYDDYLFQALIERSAHRGRGNRAMGRSSPLGWCTRLVLRLGVSVRP